MSPFGRWSPIVWKKDESRISGAFDFCDFLVLDFDGGLAIKDALERLNGSDFLMLATKSHRVPKKNDHRVLDRFRVIIPFARRIDNLADFYATMRSAADLFPEADKKCLDAARFYWTRGKGEIARGEGDPFEVKNGDENDRKKAFAETFGSPPSDLKGFNLTSERICVIKSGGFGLLRFDFVDSRSMTSQSPNYSKRVKKPFRLGRLDTPSHWWAPAKKPVREKIKTLNSQGETAYRAGRFLREDWRERGLIAFEIEGKISRKFMFLRGLITRHPGGSRLWVAYDVTDSGGVGLGKDIEEKAGFPSGGPTGSVPTPTEARIEDIKKTLRELFSAMGVEGSVKAESWDFGRKIPLVPSEIQKLRDFDFSGKFIRFKDERILKKIQSFEKTPLDFSGPGQKGSRRDEANYVNSNNVVANRMERGHDSTDPIAKKNRDDHVLRHSVNHGLTWRMSMNEARPVPLTRKFWKSLRELDVILGHPKLCGGLSLIGETLTVRTSPLRISAKKIVDLISDSAAGDMVLDVVKAMSMERSVRRLVSSLVEDGYLVTVDKFYVPGRRGRVLSPTRKLFEEIFQAGILVDEAQGRLPPRAGVEVILDMEDSSPSEIGEPTDGLFNEWVWRAAWKFSTRRDFFDWLNENHGEFLLAKNDRWGQAENAWKRRQTFKKK